MPTRVRPLPAGVGKEAQSQGLSAAGENSLLQDVKHALATVEDGVFRVAFLLTKALYDWDWKSVAVFVIFDFLQTALLVIHPFFLWNIDWRGCVSLGDIYIYFGLIPSSRSRRPRRRYFKALRACRDKWCLFGSLKAAGAQGRFLSTRFWRGGLNAFRAFPSYPLGAGSTRGGSAASTSTLLSQSKDTMCATRFHRSLPALLAWLARANLFACPLSACSFGCLASTASSAWSLSSPPSPPTSTRRPSSQRRRTRRAPVSAPPRAHRRWRLPRPLRRPAHSAAAPPDARCPLETTTLLPPDSRPPDSCVPNRNSQDRGFPVRLLRLLLFGLMTCFPVSLLLTVLVAIDCNVR